MKHLSFKNMLVGLGFLILVGVLIVVLFGLFKTNNAIVIEDKKSTLIDSSLVSVDAEVFADSLKEPKVIIDVRTYEEFSTGHITGAINLDFYAPDFKAKLAELDKNGDYAIYCRSGNRSGQALSFMRSFGFTNVLDLKGGVIAWEKTGHRLCSDLQC
jgi:phage shock protein E